MSKWDEEALRHKYDPLPEDAPRHRKKAKKRHVRSDHRHEYEDVCVDTGSYEVRHGGERHPYYSVARRCRVCGRLLYVKSSLREVPDGMKLFRCKDILELLCARELPESKEVHQ